MPAPASEFFVDYDDFSGGMFVGNNDSQMPKNTFSGDNMITCEVDGMLMPAAAWVPRSDSAVVSSPPAVASGVLGAFLDGTYIGLFSIRADGGAVNVEKIDADTTNPAWSVAGRQQIITFQTSNLGFIRTGPYVAFFDGGASFPRAALYNSGGTLTNASTPVALRFPTAFGAFTVGASGSKLFWSAPSDATSWPSGNFVQIGGTGFDITAMVVLGQSLMVGKPDGWWQVVGILGENETVVQVATEGPNGLAAISADNSLAFPGRQFDGSAVRVLRGSVVSSLAFQEATVPAYSQTYSIGGYLLAVGNGPVADEVIGRSPTGRWFHLSGDHQQALKVIAFANGPATHPYAYAYLGPNNTNSFPWRMQLAPVNPPMEFTGTTFTTSTATLADYKRTSRFRVKEVIAELDLGTTTINARRAISVRVQTPGQVLEDSLSATAFSSAGSATQTVELPAMASTTGQRVTVRMSPSDGQDTYSMIPEVTLQGVKLRRLLVRCVEVGA